MVMISDPIGDFIIRLKNAGMAGHSEVRVPYSREKHAIADVLVRSGYLQSAEKRGKKVRKTLEVILAHGKDGSSRIQDVQRLSKPGRRLYARASDIHQVKFGKGTVVLSTPKGVLAGEEARKQNVGGEQLFMIW